MVQEIRKRKNCHQRDFENKISIFSIVYEYKLNSDKIQSICKVYNSTKNFSQKWFFFQREAKFFRGLVKVRFEIIQNFDRKVYRHGKIFSFMKTRNSLPIFLLAIMKLASNEAEMNRDFGSQSSLIEQYIHDFEDRVLYVEIGITRVQAVIDLFKKVVSILKEAQDQSLKDLNLNLSNTDFVTFRNEAIILLDISNISYGEFKRYIEVIEKGLDPNFHGQQILGNNILVSLTTLHAELNLEIEKVRAESESLIKPVSDAQSSFKQNLSKAHGLYENSNESHWNYTSATRSEGSNSRNVQKATEGIQNSIKSYHQALFFLSQSVQHLNHVSKAFFEGMDLLHQKLKAIDNKRIQGIVDSLNLFKCHVNDLSGFIEGKQTKLKELNSNYTTEFEDVSATMSLKRSSPLPIKFDFIELPMLKNDFEINSANVNLAKKYSVNYEINSCRNLPLKVMRAKHSFKAESQYECSFEKDQLMFLYEAPVHNWVYISSIDNETRGYGPLKFFVEENISIGILKSDHITENNGDLFGALGELVLVLEPREQQLFCRDCQGKEGLIPKDIVTII